MVVFNFATNVFEILIFQHSIYLKMTENEDCKAKTKLNAPELSRLTSIFEISALELTKLTWSHKFSLTASNVVPRKEPGNEVGCERSLLSASDRLLAV